MVSVWDQRLDRFDVAAQLVRDDDPGFAKLGNQPFEEPLCSLGVSERLNENVERVAICIDPAS